MTRLVLTVLVWAGTLMAFAPESISLFPKGVPGDRHDLSPETDTTTTKDNLVMGRAVVRLGNVTEPSLQYFPAPGANTAGPAVIVFPGGGYRILAYDLEGTEICDWLNSIGVNAVLVKYRVPELEGVPRYQAPLQDAQRAVGYVRNRALDWHIDPHRIGVLGFSAGGHLSALLSNDYLQRTYPAQDAADEVSCRPDFTILIYPAYLATGEKLDVLSPEINVTPNSPPTFLIQTEDDPVHVESSLVYFRALKEKKVPAEMHIFGNGGHGYGMRPDPAKPVTEWPHLAQNWMKSRGILP